jgi:hypothetical protein
MGFGFPRDERAALVASEPGKFMMPLRSDERYNWVRVRLRALDGEELRELLTDAWSVMQNRLRAQAFWACASGPGASSRTGARVRAFGPCERPVRPLRRDP